MEARVEFGAFGVLDARIESEGGVLRFARMRERPVGVDQARDRIG